MCGDFEHRSEAPISSIMRVVGLFICCMLGQSAHSHLVSSAPKDAGSMAVSGAYSVAGSLAPWLFRTFGWFWCRRRVEKVCPPNPVEEIAAQKSETASHPV